MTLGGARKCWGWAPQLHRQIGKSKHVRSVLRSDQAST
jgi:hypothetical protein